MTTAYVHDTSKIENVEKEVGASYIAVKKAEKKIEQAVQSLIQNIATLEDEHFWPLAEQLAKEFARAKEDSKLAIDRFLWTIVTQDDDPYLAMRFIKTYGEKVSAIYKPLFDTIEGFGDDGYGDVLDSFPLFGKRRYEMALKGEITGTCQDQYQGENYFRMFLENELCRRYGMYCKTLWEDDADV